MDTPTPADADTLAPDAFLSLEDITAEVKRCYARAGHPDFWRHTRHISMDIRGTRILGQCCLKRESFAARYVLLRFNRKLWPLMPAWQRRDTIRHEVAHAIVWLEFATGGHGVLWKQIAVAVGATPERCASYEAMGPAGVVAKAAALDRRAKAYVQAYCGCPQGVTVSKITWGRLQKGYGYSCRRCAQPITTTASAEKCPYCTSAAKLQGKKTCGAASCLNKLLQSVKQVPTLLEQALAKCQKAGLLLEPEAVEMLREVATKSSSGQSVALRLRVRSASMPELAPWTLETPFTFEVP